MRPGYKPKGKKVPAEYWFKPKIMNKVQWMLRDSDYSDYFINETGLVEQSIALMYFLMADKKYHPILTAFFECPAPSQE